MDMTGPIISSEQGDPAHSLETVAFAGLEP